MSANGKSVEEHLAWTEQMSRRLENIYEELCELEKSQNEQTDDDDMKLFELLETIDEIQAATQTIRPVRSNLVKRTTDIQDQMKLLETSFELLKLEKQAKNKG